MSTYLDKIIASTKLRLAERKSVADFSQLEAKASGRTARGFRTSLVSKAKHSPAVIAELKKASPSKGLIRERFEPVELARSYAAGGAAALSVLTDEDFFQGSLADLQAASGAVDIPILRKDFIVDAFQVLEAKAFGADAILLIVAAHPDERLKELAAEARRWGLDILCEAHDRDEIERAIELGFDTIGVNSRNLKTLVVQPNNLLDLAPLLPKNTLRVAESGIRSAKDIERLSEAGYQAFLVGEALMREAEPGKQLALLLRREYALEA